MPASYLRRLLARAVALTLVGVATVAGSLPGATAAGYGQVTGSVTGPGGVPASTIDVLVLHQDDTGAWRSVGSDSTDSEGGFSIWAPPGTHRLAFLPYVETSVYLPTYYPGVAAVEEAADVVVDSDSAQSIDVELRAGPHARVAGTITGTDGAPVPRVDVSAWTNRGTEEAPEWGWRFLARTDEQGHFLELVQPGSYRVSYRRADYAESFHGGAPSAATADDVALADGDLVRLDAVLKRATRIQGSVLTAGSPQPIPGTRVDFYRDEGAAGSPAWSLVGSVTPDWAKGTYSKHLAPGSYVVRAVDPHGEYLNVYYGNVFSSSAAPRVSLEEQTTVGNIAVRMTRRNASPMTGTGVPVVTGPTHVGATLDATPGSWSPTPTTVTYQWYADGAVLPGATTATYQPAESDLGRSLAARVQAYTPGRLPASQTSAQTGPVLAVPATPERVGSSTALRASAHGTTVRLRIRVDASARVAGTVKVRRAGRLLRSVPLDSSPVIVTLRQQPRGARTYQATYRGSTTVLPSSARARVVIGPR